MPPKASAQSASAGQQIDISTLPSQQLLQIKKQLDDELAHLNSSHQSLRAAQAKFADCIRSIDAGVTSLQPNAPLLVPLTTSLYVPGQLASNENVIIDVGTGFYVEKTAGDGKKFYEGKVEELGKSLKELEGVLQGKSNNLRMIEDVLRAKVGEEQAQQRVQPAAAAAAAQAAS